VRASFGLYNTKAEVDHLLAMVRKIAAGDYHKDYVLNREKGEYAPKDFQLRFEEYFRF
jgi:hypothetical protein